MKREFELDPTSDRYRVCPNCETEFMTPHRTRKFCEDWCRNEYHNAIKRKECIRKIERGSLEWNVKVLEGIHIPSNGLKLSMQEMIVIGVDISNYESKVFLYQSEEGDVYLFQFGNCFLRRLGKGTFLLTKEINKDDRN